MNRINYYRNKSKTSLGVLSKLTGLSSAYICLLASDKRSNPSKEVMESISKALGKTVIQVFYPNIKEAI